MEQIRDWLDERAVPDFLDRPTRLTLARRLTSSNANTNSSNSNERPKATAKRSHQNHSETQTNNMTKTTIAAVIAAATFAVAGQLGAQGDHYVEGHTDQNGTYVSGHWQTNPDGNPWNNWSTRGNYNPYTGKEGTVNPWATPVPRR